MSEFAGYTRAELLVMVEKLTREQNSIACQTPCDMASQTDEPEPEPHKNIQRETEEGEEGEAPEGQEDEQEIQEVRFR